MNRRYIGIGPTKAISVDLYSYNVQKFLEWICATVFSGINFCPCMQWS